MGGKSEKKKNIKKKGEKAKTNKKTNREYQKYTKLYEYM